MNNNNDNSSSDLSFYHESDSDDDNISYEEDEVSFLHYERKLYTNPTKTSPD